MPPLKVLVVGGGIAGPSMTYWLARMGANITLIERSPQMRASGQQVDLRAQGVPMMKRMGIEDDVRRVRVHESGTQLIDRRGRVKAFFPAETSGTGKQGITSEFEIMRGDLVNILYKLTEKRKNVQHLFNTTVESFTQDDAKVHVRFHDGRSDDYDLVVGADGTGSRTRRMMLGPEAADARHSLGGHLGFFSVPPSPADTDRFTLCHLSGLSMARWIATRKDCPELTRVYMHIRGEDAALSVAQKSGNLADLKKAWADIFRGGGWECDRFVDALVHSPEANDLYSTPMEEVRLPEGSWSKGRVVLVGDAAHSQTANGVGCTWGLVGPYVLAGEISRLCKNGMSHAEAIQEGAKNYERVFRPIATCMHGQIQWIENVLSPRSSLGISLLHTVARVMAYLQIDAGAGFDSKLSKWQLPDYEELKQDVQTPA